MGRSKEDSEMPGPGAGRARAADRNGDEGDRAGLGGKRTAQFQIV